MKTGNMLPQVNELSEAMRETWHRSLPSTFRETMAQ